MPGTQPSGGPGAPAFFAGGPGPLFSAKSTRIFDEPILSPERRMARSTQVVSENSMWQKSVPLRLLLSNRISLISPHLPKISRISSSVTSPGRPPTHTVRQSSGFCVSGTVRSLPTRYAANGLSSAKSTRMGTPWTGVPASAAALSTASVSKNLTWPNLPFLSWFTCRQIISTPPHGSKRSMMSCSEASMETSPTQSVWPFGGLTLLGRYRRLLGASASSLGL
mmetsp:Transcript_65856/g.157329  ORF Transcript_65856/g.157329 Transcript_65856/m.157329 type:complete len:223 (-) Transcript_65856:616-1284(-)